MSVLKLPAHLDNSENKKLRKEFTKLMSERLKEVRKMKGLTQQELADRSGLHLTYVGHLEQGTYHPTVYVMWKIAKALGVTLNDLIGF
jgi:XRE family transcriptional regulator, regulator of sulfur utilization